MKSPRKELNVMLAETIQEQLTNLQEGQKSLLEKLNKLEIGQAEIKGDIKALDTKVEQLIERVLPLFNAIQRFLY